MNTAAVAFISVLGLFSVKPIVFPISAVEVISTVTNRNTEFASAMDGF